MGGWQGMDAHPFSQPALSGGGEGAVEVSEEGARLLAVRLAGKDLRKTRGKATRTTTKQTEKGFGGQEISRMKEVRK